MSRARSVVVQGAGIAAMTCARILNDRGWRVRLKIGHDVVRPPHLLLSQTTAGLLAALWDDANLLADSHPIEARTVFWGGAHASAAVSSPGVAVDASLLRRRLAAKLALDPAVGSSWLIDARSGRCVSYEEGEAMQCFGRRRAWIAPVTLRPGAPAGQCVMETVDAGWVFLLPIGPGRANLQFVSVPTVASVTPDPSQILHQTRCLPSSVGEIGAWSDPIPCMPRLRLPVGHPGRPGEPSRMALGEAAMAFDPISGDGVGHALRGAVLAATVLQTAAAGTPAAVCLARYSAMLRRVMCHHLRTCIRFYRDAMSVYDWCEEISAMEEAVKSLTGDAVPRETTRGWGEAVRSRVEGASAS